MHNNTGAHRRRRRRAITVIGLGPLMVGALAAPALGHPLFPNSGPGFPNPTGGTGVGTAGPPYAPGSTPTLNMFLPFEQEGVIFNGAENTTVDVKVTVPAGWTAPACGAASTSVGASQVGSTVPGWTCVLETAAGHDVLHWSGPQVAPAQTFADSAQFFTFTVTTPSPSAQTSYGAQSSPAEGYFVVQVYANGETSTWKAPNNPAAGTVANGLVRTVAGTAPTPTPTASPLPPPVLRASDGKIVFRSRRDGGLQELYLMNADGTGVTRLTTNTALDAQPALSPDGTRIAFASDRDGNNEIYVMNADGTGPTRLTTNTQADEQPVFSQDGTRIAFRSDRDGNNEIYVMNADGSGQTRLTTNTASDGAPTYSPDGTRIAFNSNRDGNSEIYRMNADGSGQTRLNAAGGEPVFTAIGQIVFASVRDGNFEIYRMNADGSGQTRLTTDAADDFESTVSPDGTKTAFTTDRVDNFEIYVMNTTAAAGRST